MSMRVLNHRVVGALLVLLMAACRGAAPPRDRNEITAQSLAALVDSLMPHVADAAELPFRTRPVSAIRSVEELRRFLQTKLVDEMPPERVEGLSSTYRLLGLIPDTLDLMGLLEEIYAEQIAGFYDPDSTALYFVSRGDPAQVRFLLAHEMTHALQHQYLPIDSILKARDDGDRIMAAQAMLEGHAQLVAMLTLLPGQDILKDRAFLDQVEDQMRVAQASMPVFRTAPLIIREALIAPYLRGTTFLHWFRNQYPGEQPFGERMPRSTEQILHPQRYADGDEPVTLRFQRAEPGLLNEDTFGELEITVLRSVLVGIEEVPTEVAMGWGGDRYRVVRTPDGPALVWYTLWDTDGAAQRFRTQIAERLPEAVARPGYRVSVDSLMVGQHPGVRVVIAPTGWTGWQDLPQVAVVPRQ